MENPRSHQKEIPGVSAADHRPENALDNEFPSEYNFSMAKDRLHRAKDMLQTQLPIIC
jgi:hypothetical protein